MVLDFSRGEIFLASDDGSPVKSIIHSVKNFFKTTLAQILMKKCKNITVNFLVKYLYI